MVDRFASAASEARIPSVPFGVAEVPTSVTIAAVPPEPTMVPCHFEGGTPIATEIIACVPEVYPRWKMFASLFVFPHGATPVLGPPLGKPRTRYAACALMMFWLEAVGTTKFMIWFGPKNSPTPAGSAVGNM